MKSTGRRLCICMRNISKPMVIGTGLVFTAIVAILAFAVFEVQTLFIDEEVDEANPFTVNASAEAEGSGPPADDPDTTEDGAAPDAATTSEPVPNEEEETAEETVEETVDVVTTVTSGTFIDGDHPTSGTALTITDGTQTFLRFEGFETDNGPDLNVYLRSSEDPDDHLDLGDLKGNIGDQNYELPAGIDLERYDLVDIWCVRFGVSFGSATLSV